jgi:hypothetical protein
VVRESVLEEFYIPHEWIRTWRMGVRDCDGFLILSPVHIKRKAWYVRGTARRCVSKV